MGTAKETYSRQKHKFAIINIVSSPLLLFCFVILGLAAYLKNAALLISSNDYINLLGFAVLIGITYSFVTLPIAYLSGFALEHKYSLSNQTLKDWLGRELKKGALSFIIAIPLIFSLYAFIRYWPLYWWQLTALTWFFISILVSKFAPILIVPIFYKYSPIKNAGLKDKLIKLSLKAGFRTEEVYEINMSRDTKKANAAVMGIGRQKRIVLCDTLLETFSEDEIESVMGHELGHHKMRHTLKLILFGGISTVLTFFAANIVFFRLYDIVGYARLRDFESLVLIYAIISALNVLILPVHNAFSRKLEQEADFFALKITNNKNAFITAMKKLAEQNLADTNPGKFYEIMLYSHPPISRRILLAESFKGLS